MVKSLQKTDTHTVGPAARVGGPGSKPIYGEHIFSVFNKRTGEEVERFDSLDKALAAQTRYDNYAKTHGL